MIVRGQRVFLHGVSAVVVDFGNGFAAVELADGRAVIVPEADLVLAESAESARARDGLR